jgi:hypothetical protein
MSGGILDRLLGGLDPAERDAVRRAAEFEIDADQFERLRRQLIEALRATHREGLIHSILVASIARHWRAGRGVSFRRLAADLLGCDDPDVVEHTLIELARQQVAEGIPILRPAAAELPPEDASP